MNTNNSTCLLINNLRNCTACEYINENCDSSFFFVAKAYYCSKSLSLWSALAYSFGTLFVTALVVVILGMIVSNYLLYCVTNFTDLFGINHKILSFFFIPLTNSLPDLFNYHAAMNSDSLDLVLGQIIGANLITFTVVIGLICIFCPFSVQANKGILIGMIWSFGLIAILGYILSDGKVTGAECLILGLLYLLYAWNSHYFVIEEGNEIIEIEDVLSTKATTLSEDTRLLCEEGNSSTRVYEIKDSGYGFWYYWGKLTNVFDHLIFIWIPVLRRTLEKLEQDENLLKMTLFKSHLFHFWMIVVCSVILNYNILHLETWELCASMVLLYLLVKFLRRHLNDQFCDVILDVSSIVSSMSIISLLTRVVIQLLKNLGAIWKISEYTMGLLIFSIVNSFNDIIMNVLLSTNLSPSLGVNSCIGTCVLLIVFGIGGNGLIRLFNSGKGVMNFLDASLEFELNAEIYASSIVLLSVVLVYIAYLPLNKWMLDRKIGIFGICVWCMATGFCLAKNLDSHI